MPLADNALTIPDKIRLAITDLEKEVLINAASDIIEDYCNTEFAQGQRVLKIKPEGQQYLMVNFWNIQSATVTYDGEEITDFTILGDQGMLYKSDGWPESNEYDLEITLTAGFVLPKDDGNPDPRDLPQGIEYACILLAQELYDQLEDGINVQRQTRGGISTTYFEREDRIPAPVRALLSRWRFIPV